MTGLSPDIQAILYALIVGIVAGITGGGVSIALKFFIRSPRRGL